jgi:hypothetical protein
LIETKIEAAKSLAATFGRLKVAKVDLSDLVIARIIKQKTMVQTARCETISGEVAGLSSGQ